MVKKQSKSKETIKNYWFSLLVICVAFSTSITIVKDTVLKIRDFSKLNKKKKERLVRLVQKVGVLSSLNENSLKKETVGVERIFPSEKPILNLLSALQQLSSEEDLVFGGLALTPGELEEKEASGGKGVGEESSLEEKVLGEVTSARDRASEEKETKKENPPPPVGEGGEKSSQLEEFDISFPLTGNIPNLISFVGKLEKMSPLMKIKEMSVGLVTIRGERKEGGKGIKEASGEDVNISFIVSVYYQATSLTIGTIDSPISLLSEAEEKILAEVKTYHYYEAIEPTAPIGREDPFEASSEFEE